MSELEQKNAKLVKPAETEQTNQDMPISNKNVDILSQIDDTELSVYILNLLKNDVRDREAYGWNFRQQYSVYAYEGYKKRPENEPWKNSSNYAVRMTSTLVDTAHANTVSGIFSNEDRVVSVRGIGQEDERSAENLSSLLNWQIFNDIEDSYDVIDKTVMTSYKAGNAVVKCIQGYQGIQKSKVIWERIPIENVFLPVNAKGAQPSQSDHFFELIPLSENEWKKEDYVKG